MKKLLISLLAISLVAACSKSDEQDKTGCAKVDLLPRKVAIDAAQYKPYEGKGKSELHGKLCVSVGEGQECLANQLIVLNPVTDYSTEWFSRNWTKNEPLQEADPIAKEHNKTTKTAQDGSFSFTDLRPGTYYVGAVADPCEAGRQKQNDGFKYQRLGSKVTAIGKTEVTLRKVYEAN